MANKSNNTNRNKRNTFIPAMGNNKMKGNNQQFGNKQVFDKRRKDNAKVKY